MSRSVCLKPNVLAEPLFNQWYAWPYLIPPVSAAMYTANAHLKMMESFVAAPQVHAPRSKIRPCSAGRLSITAHKRSRK